MFSILYIDDEPGLLEIGKLFLEQGGQFSVETLTSATEALEILHTAHYDAIISDYQMPVIDGIEFLKRVRASGNTVPFIIFTGRGREEIVIQALNEGADFYLQKGGEPVSQFAELAHKIRQAVQQRLAEASIRDHERRETDIINFLPDATFAIDNQGVVIAWNRAMEKMTGVPAAQVLGRDNYEYAVPFYHERRPILIDLVLSDDPSIEARYPYIKRDGKTLFSEITIPHFNGGRGAALSFIASRLYDTRGTVVGAIESIREITEWKKAEDALNESEKFLTSVVENIPDMIFVKDARDLRFVQFNKAGEELLGYTSKDLCGKNDYDFFPKDEADFFTKNDRMVLDNRQAVDIPEEKIQTRFKGERILHTKKIPIPDETGTPVYLMGISEDITDRRRADRELKNSVAFLNSLIDQSPTPMWISDGAGTLIRINRACCELLNLDEADVVGKFSIFDDTIIKEQGFLPLVSDVFDKGVIAQFQLDYDTSRLKNLDLKRYASVILDVTVFPVRDSRGKISNAVIQHANITRRKKAEVALKESEQKYRTVFETTGTATVLIENDATISLANSEFARLSGYRKDEIENRMKWTEFVVKEDLDRMLAQHRLRRQDPASALHHYDFRFRTRPGEVRDIYLTIDVIPGTTKSVASLLDITERKKTENAVRESEQQYRNVVEDQTEFISRFLPDGTHVFVNDAYCRYFSLKRDEILGHRFRPQIPAEDRERMKRFFASLTPDHPVDIIVHRIIMPDGNIRWQRWSDRAIFDASGAVTEYQSVGRDITETKETEIALMASEERYRLIADNTADHIWIFDMDLNPKYTSPSVTRMKGFTVAETLSQSLGEMMTPASVESVLRRFHEEMVLEATGTADPGRTITFETEEYIKDGSTIMVENVVTLMRDPDGRLVSILGISRDITARKSVEQALRESEDRYRKLVEITPDAILVHQEGKIVFINPAGLELLGAAHADQVVGKPVLDLIQSESRETVRTNIERDLQGERTPSVELRVLRLDGESVSVEGRGVLTVYQGKPAIQVAIRDVTERKLAEEQLKESRERFQKIFEDSPLGIAIVSNGFSFRMVNRQFCEMLKYTEAELLTKSFPDITHPDNLTSDIAESRKLFTGEREVYKTEKRYLKKDGSILWASLTASAVKDENGRFLYAIALIEDISERKKAEQELVTAYQEYQNLLDQIQDVYYRSDTEGRLIRISRSLTTLLGYRDISEIIGKNIAEEFYFHPADRTKLLEEINRKGMVTNYEVQLRRTDGRPVTISASSHIWYHPDGTPGGVEGSFRDITEQKRAEDDLRQKTKDLDSRNRLISTLLDTVPIGIFMVEAPSGKPIIANREATRLLGRGILPDATDKNLAEIYEAYNIATSQRYPTQEMPIVCGMYGESRHIDDMVVVRPDGTKVQLEIFGTPVIDSQGGVTASLVSMMDITDRKRAEQVIREANRKINLLTSITRHDVGNQVIILRGFTKIALMKKPDPEVAGLLEKIDAAVSTIARQIEFTRAYQELGMHAPGWQGIRDIVAQQKTDGISLSCTCDAEVFADPMFERVFYNLIDNAVRHGETVTAITVSCRPDPDGLVIVVGDDGVGVPTNLKEKIFEKGYGKNTGFGLFLAREILAITGIIILETGTHGKGARFEIIVPKGMFRFVP